MEESPRATPAAPDDRRRRARRVVAVGFWTFCGSCAFALLPLLWGRWDVNRYLVAFGLLGACLGASFMFHGTWDWLRARPK